MWEILQLFLPALILAMLLLAPRRGGRPRWRHAKPLAVFVLVWAAVSIALGLAWNRLGLAALWVYTTGNAE